ncbi:MAG TPA: efflux RND transporter periplasmic adaptor subunit [Longimicrobium sp.]|jgi:HlyD family secretion protein|uniref:efflux RND transporter periplasmic adaptor subunit n=1 Tax=Longimicrobium sp. TaxID=2029185 RepID=UPI002ED9D2A3
MSTKKKALIIAGVVAAVSVLGALTLRGGGEKGAEVSTEAVARRTLVEVVTASGKIEPKRKVDISADISGRVVQVAVEEGQWVDAGALLLRIDPTQFVAATRRAEAAVSQARAREAQSRAQLTKAQADARRAEQLMQTNELVSAADVENARTTAQVAEQELQAARFAVTQAQAALSESRDQLSKTTIVAPMSGRVTRLNIEQGETAVVGTMNNPGSLLLTIADLSVMEAKVEVDETDIPGLTVGDSAAVKVDAFPGQVFPGRVTAIGNSSIQLASGQSADQQSVDYEVVITLDNPPAELRPDLSATAEIVTETRANALSVPILALTVRDAQGKKFRVEDADEKEDGAPAAPAREDEEEIEGVFVVREGKARWVPVRIGIAGDRYFEVVSGLRGGETVVSGSYAAVRELEDEDAVQVPAETEKDKAGEKGKAAAGERRKG